MKKAWLRSLFFNLAFYAVTAFLAVLYIPALLLPREMFVALVRFWLRVVMVLEYSILGLKFRIVGLENLPKQGSYIVAAKHQSAYETLKLHLIFRDPAIILKKELLWIPLFGAYLKKAGMIAIDRGTPEAALRSVQAGVLRVKDEGRPIIIFPQGTRVAPGTTADEKPYKPGLVRIQDVTELPIIPLALNSGLFWPRNAWLKSPGRVTFQIMKAIKPGKDRQALMTELEEKIESATNTLVAEARTPRAAQSRRVEIFKRIVMAFMILAACGFYGLWWQIAAQAVKNKYIDFHGSYASLPPLVVTGFPGPMKIRVPEETIQTPDGTMIVKDVYIHGLPLPLAPITLTTGEITVTSYRWAAPLTLQGVEGYFTYLNHKITIKDSLIKKDDFRASVAGTVDLHDDTLPTVDMVVRFMNHQSLLNTLALNGIIDQQAAMFMSAGFTALADPATGIVSVPVTQRERTLYAGPFAFAELPVPNPPTAAPLSGATDNPPAQVP